MNSYDTILLHRLNDSPPAYATVAKANPEMASRALGLKGTDVALFNNNSDSIAACKRRGISPVFASQIHYVREFSKIRIAIDVSASMGLSVMTYGKDLVWILK